jgi:uncharacterized small protein (DUF1192 family)
MDECTGDHAGRVVTDGVTLRKRMDGSDADQPTVTYEIDSDRDDAVTVTIIETIPESLDPAAITFYGPDADDHWSVKGPKLVFENELAAGATRKTACRATGPHAGPITELSGDPDAVEVEPVGDTAATGLVSIRPPAGADGGRETEVSEPPTAADERADADAMVEQVARELEAGRVSEEALDVLRREIGAPATPRHSVEARLKQLQTDVADVRAYTNALESFLDENGSASEVVDRLDARLDRLADAVDQLDDAVESHEAELASVREDVADLERLVGANTDDVSDLDNRVTGLRDEVDRLEAEQPADLDERVATIEDELDRVSRFTDSLRSAFD